MQFVKNKKFGEMSGEIKHKKIIKKVLEGSKQSQETDTELCSNT